MAVIIFIYINRSKNKILKKSDSPTLYLLYIKSSIFIYFF